MLGPSLKKIREELSKHDRRDIEIEAKFGVFFKNNFTSKVSYTNFDRLLAKLRNELANEIQEESTVRRFKEFRKIITAGDGDEKSHIQWQHKRKIKDFDINDYEIKVSISKEYDVNEETVPSEIKSTINGVNPYNKATVRDRTRHTFELSDYKCKVDMTSVMMMINDKIVHQYEIEVEFLGDINDLTLFQNCVELIFKWSKGSHNIYTVREKENVIADLYGYLGGDNDRLTSQQKGGFSKSKLAKARNIKRDDLVSGGIINNKNTTYLVAYKADGTRKILVIHSSGIWLVYHPNEYNFVIDLKTLSPNSNLRKFIVEFVGTVLDGELVLPKDNSKYKNVLHYYLAFNCLSFKGNSSIQDLHYIENTNVKYNRYKIIKGLSNIETDILKIGTIDTFHILTPEDFFNNVNILLDKRKDLDYHEDGLMFFPEAFYNPHSEDLPMHQRNLSLHPDICKWKPSKDITIDFSVRLINNKIILESYDKKNKKLVPFLGSKTYPLTEQMIDHNNPLTKNIPTGTVVEYEWQHDANMLVPRKIRYDKFAANSLDIALDDWKDIHNPILEDDIRGVSLDMAFSSHERIKKKLFENLYVGSDILDIGSGQWNHAKIWKHISYDGENYVNSVVAVEPYIDNIKLLQDKVKDLSISDYVKIVPTGAEDTVTITKEVKTFFSEVKADAIILLLSLQNYWETENHLNALVTTILSNLKPGGQLILFTVDGYSFQKLFDSKTDIENIPGVTILNENTIKLSDCVLHLNNFVQNSFSKAFDINCPKNKLDGSLVYLDDLTGKLSHYGIELFVPRTSADTEQLLSPVNKLYAGLFSYAIYVNNDPDLLLEYQQTNIPKNVTISNYVDDLQSEIVSPHTIDKLEHNSSSAISEDSFFSDDITDDSQDSFGSSSIEHSQASSPAFVKPFIKHSLNEDTGLPWLNVIHKNVTGNSPAINDDTYAPLNCSWYDNLVRIATIGDGSCFIHAVLKAFYKPYQDKNEAQYRISLAKNTRRDLAVALASENPNHKGYTYWESVANGSFPSYLMQEIKDESEIERGGVDYSLTGLQRLFNSSTPLGNEVYKYISDILNIDIYILRASSSDLHYHENTRKKGVKRNSIVIVGNKYHYEVLAVDTQYGFQTIFSPDDPFINKLSNLFINDTDLAEEATDLDTIFVNNFVNSFISPDTGLFEFPDSIYKIFNSNDPFVLTVDRLKDDIYSMAKVAEQNNEEAKLETQREYDMYLKLNNTLISMLENEINNRGNNITIERKPANILSLEQIFGNLIVNNFITEEMSRLLLNLKKTILDYHPKDTYQLEETVENLNSSGIISKQLYDEFVSSY